MPLISIIPSFELFKAVVLVRGLQKSNQWLGRKESKNTSSICVRIGVTDKPKGMDLSCLIPSLYLIRLSVLIRDVGIPCLGKEKPFSQLIPRDKMTRRAFCAKTPQSRLSLCNNTDKQNFSACVLFVSL